MSGVGGLPTDALVTLLDIIKDPKAHGERILEFQQKEKLALAAEDKLSSTRRNIAADRAQLKDDQAAHDKVVASFLAEKTRILETAKGFTEWERKLHTREEAVAQREFALESDKESHLEEWKEKSKVLKNREDIVQDRERAVSRLEISMATKEKYVTDKLDKIRKFIGETADV